MSSTILIADIGGTNARFALCNSASTHFYDQQTFSARDYISLDAAISAYLNSIGINRLKGMSLAVAGPIQNGSVQFLNSNWSIDTTSLIEEYELECAQLLNDWEALALSIPYLESEYLLDLSPSLQSDVVELSNNGNYVAVGPGSGLGATGLIIRNMLAYPIASEAGHVGFAPESPTQCAMLECLRERLGKRVSYERLLSGPGIENIYASLCQLNDIQPSYSKAAEISEAGIANTDVCAQESMELFFELLGQFTGDLVLSLGGYNGAFIGGGICQRFPQALLNSSFRKGFENKGRHRGLLEATPSWLIQHENPGLLGAAAWASNNLK